MNDYEAFLNDHFGTTVVTIILASSVLIDVSKIKLNPWKWIFRQLSKPVIAMKDEMLKEVTAEIVNLTAVIAALSAEVSSMRAVMHEDKKSELRRAILRFADECRIHYKHSKEMFENALTDISDYSKLVNLTDDPNHVLTNGVDMIEKSYRKCLEDNDFL